MTVGAFSLSPDAVIPPEKACSSLFQYVLYFYRAVHYQCLLQSLQAITSHYKKPVFEKVLFYMLHRKKTGQKTQPRPFIGRIWSSAKWIVSIPIFLIHLPFWQTGTWSAIWTCEFFINSKTDLFSLSSECNFWSETTFSFINFPPICTLIHFIHPMRH